MTVYNVYWCWSKKCPCCKLIFKTKKLDINFVVLFLSKASSIKVAIL